MTSPCLASQDISGVSGNAATFSEGVPDFEGLGKGFQNSRRLHESELLALEEGSQDKFS